MTISIWIIVIIILSGGFWFYYKKNKYKVQTPEIKEEHKKSKRSFSDIDKMLSHIEENKKDDNLLNNIGKAPVDIIESEMSDSKENEPDDEFNIKEKVFGSIILERKKKK